MTTTMQTETAEARPPAREPIRPTRTWYWVAGVVTVVGLVVGLAVALFGYFDALDEFDAFPGLSTPGTTEVVVDEPGDQVIYYQGAGFTDLAALGISATDPSGSAVEVEVYGSELIFHTGEGQTRAVATFEADTTGTYRVEAEGAAGGTLAVGPSWAWIALPPVLGGLGLAGFSFMVGALMWLVTIIRRSNAAARHPQPPEARP